MSKKIWKILMPVMIFLVVGGIWFYKNEEKQVEKQQLAVNASLQYPLLITELNLPELLGQGLPVMIDFGADYCPPCREMAPTLRELNAEYQGRMIIVYADIERYPKLAEGFPLEVIPTQFFFNRDGSPYVPSAKRDMQLQRYVDKATNQHKLTAHQGLLRRAQLIEIFKELGVSDA
ncbi:MAG TPA: thioredoxin family protein [Candidatus Avacidaminococcus intestinavium]|uniref:Thioredoxin family protein n=1 Tax=Candidatus Avacidaminococcus intestinavium TaxID=2840684 RepID=A0A9D1SLN4_9FIRM|nr:thioredoxin family protein [Candidatus Avacidaminococcus intestinavium]